MVRAGGGARVWVEGAGGEMGHEVVMKGSVEAGMAFLDCRACSHSLRTTHGCPITGSPRNVAEVEVLK